MSDWSIELDNDWHRAGFSWGDTDLSGIEIRESERLGVSTVLIVVAVIVGKRVFTKGVDAALKAPVKRLADFARSRESRMRLEVKAVNIDPRVQSLFAKIEAVDPDEFERAIAALPLLKARTDHVLRVSPEYFTAVWYVWSGDDWTFSFAETEGHDYVTEEPK